MTITHNQVILFDLDDTILDTHSLYRRAKNELVQLIYKEIPSTTSMLSENKILTLINMIDSVYLERMGLTRVRFPLTLQKVMHIILDIIYGQGDFKLESKAFKIGDAVFESIIPLIDGAVNTLTDLDNHGFDIRLYTEGDPSVQVNKVSMIPCNHVFSHIYIACSEKDKPSSQSKDKRIQFVTGKKSDMNTLKNLINTEGLSPINTWMVGNSMKSDINPAISNSIKSVWFEGHGWYHDTATPMDEAPVLTVQNIHDVVDIILRHSRHS